MSNEILKMGKIGLLPLYLELYDQIMPQTRQGFETFIEDINSEFNDRDITIVHSSICRLQAEFENAINQFEKERVDCIVTLHLAYSPSLECIDALSDTKLPIIILDTTRDEHFDSISQLLFNHGIHGVQDMCNLLLRRRKGFIIEAGHIKSSPEFVDRVVQHIRGARLANEFRNARVAQIGGSFNGMGDFIVCTDVLNELGVEILNATVNQIAKFLPGEGDQELLDEIVKDKERFDCSKLRHGQLESSVIEGVALRRWLKRENITAFTINFQSVTRYSGISQMPFLEICKAMGNRIGYAGEGDVLTAALVGAMAEVFGNVSFTEMFCPDWKNNLIFMSHMGEMNINLAEDKPILLEKEWSFSDAKAPVYPSACLKRGNAILVNLAPGYDNLFSLILTPVKMMGEIYTETIGNGIRGWMKPNMPLPEFLKKFSEAGGTHHSALVYGQPLEELRSFGKIMGWKIVEIK